MKYNSILRRSALAVALALSLQGWAKTITADEALKIATGIIPGVAIDQNEQIRVMGQGVSVAPYYVFNTDGDAGFVVISGDDRLGTVLAYSDSGNFSLDDAPEGLRALMQIYTEYVAALPQDAPSRAAVAPGTPVVEPLLGEIAWGQDSPFNSSVPTYTSSGETKNYYTGCVATAATQIMKFYNYPTQGQGTKSYTGTAGTLSADFGATTYDWDNMPAAVPASPTTEQTTAYSRLAADMGVAVEMEYAPAGSGAYTMMLPTALKDYFKYDKSLRMHSRSYYNTDEWMKMIRTELDARRPVYYAATCDDNSGGHAFVCDGYDSNDFVHINWGWYGRSNGWFMINHLNPSDLGEGAGTGGYNLAQEIITDFVPARENSADHYTLYGSTRMSCNSFGTDMMMMAFVDNLDTRPYEGPLAAVISQDGKVVKVLEQIDVTIKGFSNGLSGTYQLTMRQVPLMEIDAPDGDYRINFAYKDPDGSWVLLRHPIGLPAYASGTLKDGTLTVTSTHVPVPKVELLKPITTDGDVYADGMAAFALSLDNKSDDYRLKKVAVKLTSVNDPSLSFTVQAEVDVYDLSRKDVTLLAEIPAEITAGEYYLTAYEASQPDYPFDDSKVGRTTVTVLPASTTPVIRVIEKPEMFDATVTEVAEGISINLLAGVRNYAATGTAEILARMIPTDGSYPHGYVLRQVSVNIEKGKSQAVLFTRVMPYTEGEFRLALSSVDADGEETPLEGYDNSFIIKVVKNDQTFAKVTELTLPEELVIGERASYSVTIDPLVSGSGTLYVRLRQFTDSKGEIVYMKSAVRLNPGTPQTITFNYRPALTEGYYIPIVEFKLGSVTLPCRGLEDVYKEFHAVTTSGIEDVIADGNDATASRHLLTPTVTTGVVDILSTTEVMSVEVYSVGGALVGRYPQGTTQIDLGGVAPGMYLVRITDAEGAVTQRVIRR